MLASVVAAAATTATPSLPSTMLAVRVANFTPCVKPAFQQCLETSTVKVPKPLPLEALVRVNVSSVNPSDVDIAEGRVVGKLFGTLGVDFGGVVVAKGWLCSNLEVGDAVWGMTVGAYAEYAIASTVRWESNRGLLHLQPVFERDVRLHPLRRQSAPSLASSAPSARAPWAPCPRWLRPRRRRCSRRALRGTHRRI